jgi:formylglycine-generating enzyme required for sulfatase activity
MDLVQAPPSPQDRLPDRLRGNGPDRQGEFTQGITENELNQVFILDGSQNPVFMTEVPARKVKLEAYYIDLHPVTNFQYSRFMEATGHRKPQLWEREGWRTTQSG